MRPAKPNTETGLYIANDEPSWKRGNHWILIFCLKDNVYFIDLFARSFCHYGMDKKLKTFKQKLKSNTKAIPGPFSNSRGQFFVLRLLLYSWKRDSRNTGFFYRRSNI